MSADREALLEKLRNTPPRLERLVGQHPNDVLCQAGAGGSWGCVEIMAFIRDWDEVVLDRVDQILVSDNPEFPEEDLELWAIERDYHAEDPDAVKVEIRAGREALVNRLSEVAGDDWNRPGKLADGTDISLEDMVNQLISSDQEQLEALRAMLQ